MTVDPGDYPIISGDSHLEVDSKRWIHRVDARYRDLVPRLVRLPNGGDGWVVGDEPPREVPSDLYGGKGRDVWQPFGQTYEGTAGTGSPEQRLQEQDRDGVWAEVLYPNQVSGPRLWGSLKGHEGYASIVRGYNDWLAEEYCATAPDRLIGVGVIPRTGVRDAIAEMEHCAQLGLKLVLLTTYPSGKGYPTDEDDEFWQASLNRGMPITIHVDIDRSGSRGEPSFVYARQHREVRMGLVEQVARFAPTRGSGGLTAVQMVLHRVFDRFRDLKILFAENQIGWIPFFFQTADVRYDRHVAWAERLLGFSPLDRMPSEYIRDHCLWGFQFDAVGVELRHHIGIDNLVWGSDFPHQESDWPNSRAILDRNFANVTAEERYKMTCGNIRAFLGLGEGVTP